MEKQRDDVCGCCGKSSRSLVILSQEEQDLFWCGRARASAITQDKLHDATARPTSGDEPPGTTKERPR